MKTTSIKATLAALSLLPAIVRADLVLVQETITGGVTTRTTMSIKGDKIRTDNGTSTSMIMNTATGDMTTLMHDQKMVTTMNLKALQGSLPAAAAADAAKIAEPKITATGKKEKIDGQECEIYTSETGGMVVKMWVAADYPGLAELKKEMASLSKLAAPGAPKTPEIPGMLLKSEFEQGGIKFTTKLVSATTKSVSDELFKQPAGYKAPGT